jgi:hypothetical protein
MVARLLSGVRVLECLARTKSSSARARNSVACNRNLLEFGRADSRPRHVRLSSETYREGEPASLEPWRSSTTPAHEISDPRRNIIGTNALM